MTVNIFKQKINTIVVPKKINAKPEVITMQKQQETQLTDKRKILDNTLVAGLVKKSNRILASISSHKFPFDFFPDTINVEEGRINVILRYFFLSSEVHSVDIKDISNVFINIAPFFAELIIVSKTFSKNEIKIKNLRKEEAIYARRIIEGLRSFESKLIDTSNFGRDELIAKLKELSTTEIVT
ncbi:MAG: hypothetical protein Q7R95_07260 [bacterium]|nr:hypothetical protein [bacterium]